MFLSIPFTKLGQFYCYFLGWLLVLYFSLVAPAICYLFFLHAVLMCSWQINDDDNVKQVYNKAKRGEKNKRNGGELEGVVLSRERCPAWSISPVILIIYSRPHDKNNDNNDNNNNDKSESASSSSSGFPWRYSVLTQFFCTTVSMNVMIQTSSLSRLLILAFFYLLTLGIFTTKGT